MLFPLEKTRVKSGTVLIETVLSGDYLYKDGHEILKNVIFPAVLLLINSSLIIAITQKVLNTIL